MADSNTTLYDVIHINYKEDTFSNDFPRLSDGEVNHDLNIVLGCQHKLLKDLPDDSLEKVYLRQWGRLFLSELIGISPEKFFGDLELPVKDQHKENFNALHDLALNITDLKEPSDDEGDIFYRLVANKGDDPHKMLYTFCFSYMQEGDVHAFLKKLSLFDLSLDKFEETIQKTQEMIRKSLHKPIEMPVVC
jgi:hypothetical protein